jgi:hypothetical protein
VDNLRRRPQAVDDALPVQRARHVGRGDVLGPVTVEVADAVVVHPGRDRLAGDAEAAAEAASFVGPVDPLPRQSPQGDDERRGGQVESEQIDSIRFHSAPQPALTWPSSFIRSFTWMRSSEPTAALISLRRPSSARSPTSLSNFAATSSQVNGRVGNPG